MSKRQRLKKSEFVRLTIGIATQQIKVNIYERLQIPKPYMIFVHRFLVIKNSIASIFFLTRNNSDNG